MPDTKVDLSKYNDFKPIAPTGLELAFGASTDFKKFAPMYLGYKNCEVREKDCKQFWLEVFSQMFYNGLGGDSEFVSREGIDAKTALQHIRVVASSFEPDHNSKEYICAFLFNLWFKDFKPGIGVTKHFLNSLNAARKDLDSPVFG